MGCGCGKSTAPTTPPTAVPVPDRLRSRCCQAPMLRHGAPYCHYTCTACGKVCGANSVRFTVDASGNAAVQVGEASRE